MNLSPKGLELLERSEGFRAQVYRDIAGVLTIGYGHKLEPGESFPDGVTEEEGQVICRWDVHLAEQAVNRLVKVPLTQGQFDALVDFVFNLGSARLASSTLLELLNEGFYDAAAVQLLRWDHGMENGKEVEIDALKARRSAEFSLWHAPAAA